MAVRANRGRDHQPPQPLSVQHPQPLDAPR